MRRPPELLLQRGPATQRFVLPVGRVCLGRASANDVVIDDDLVSRHHAELAWDGKALTLRDLESANGTFVKGVRVNAATLDHTHELRLGNTLLQVNFPDRDSQATSLFAVPELPTNQPEHSLATLDTELNRRPVPMLLVCTRDDIVEHPLNRSATTIGRDLSCDLQLEHDAISRLHARIEQNGVYCTLLETGSTNGILVNGDRVTRHRLREGDVIQIGPIRLVFVEALVEVEADPEPDESARRPVVLVPGFMGSELWRGSERLWPDWTRFLLDPAMLRLENSADVRVGGIVQEVVVAAGLIKLDRLGRLTNFLVETMGYTRGVDLLEFSYDWRRDVRDASLQLARAIEEWRERESSIRDQPITVVAHSMGSLVARHYLDQRNGHTQVNQLIAMGGPHGGAPEAVASLTAGTKLSHIPGLSFGLLFDRLRDTIYSFDSMYQLVPEYECATNGLYGAVVPLGDAFWLPEQHRVRLALGRELRNSLAATPRVQTLSVVGYGQPTITGLRMAHDEGARGISLQPMLSLSGDGVVPTQSAALPGSDILPVRQGHGTLFVDRDVRRRLRRVLRVNGTS